MLLQVSLLAWAGLLLFFVACISLYRCCKSNSRTLTLPPIAASRIPYLEHLLVFLFGGARLFEMLLPYLGGKTPVRFNLFGVNVFLITSSENIQMTVHDDISFSDAHIRARFITNVFRVRKQAADVVKTDTTGSARWPIGGRDAPAQRRIIRMQQTSTFDLLSNSAGIYAFVEHFTDCMMESIAAAGIGNNWIERPDVYQFIRDLGSKSSFAALCGPRLLENSPNLVDSFWKFDANVHWLHVGVPRWLKPAAYKARDECLEAIVKWKRLALRKPYREYPDSVLWDETWGLECMRNRHAMYEQFPEFNDEMARAGADLGIIWASNDNLVPTACWLIHALLCDSSLRERCVARMNHARLPHHPGDVLARFDSSLLVKDPLLQSVYNEILRTKVTSFIARTVERDVEVGGHHIPKGSITLCVPWLENHDQTRWEIRPGARPVREFWPERFLVYPESSCGYDNGKEIEPTHQNGSSTNAERLSSPSTDKHAMSQEQKPRLSMKGLEGTFMPFGSGHHICPGRHLATHVILTMTAMIICSFDFEPADKSRGWALGELDYQTFGYTPFRPKEGTPFRIRTKQ